MRRTIERYGPHARHELAIHAPVSRAAPDHILVFYHGGGWRSGHHKLYGFVGHALSGHGITTVMPTYRLYPEVRFPAFVTDAALALRHVLDSVPGAAQARLTLMGHSAGAHIAALLALDPAHLTAVGVDPARIDALVGISGPYAADLTTNRRVGPIFRTDAPKARTNPLALVPEAPHLPRTLLLHGGKDRVVYPENTTRLATAMDARGARVEQKVYARLRHVDILLTIHPGLRWRAPVLADIVSFVDDDGPATRARRAR